MPPMDYVAFKKIVKLEGCLIVEGTKHKSWIYKQNLFVSSFTRTHSKGSKDIVLSCEQTSFKAGLTKVNLTLAQEHSEQPKSNYL